MGTAFLMKNGNDSSADKRYYWMASEITKNEPILDEYIATATSCDSSNQLMFDKYAGSWYLRQYRQGQENDDIVIYELHSSSTMNSNTLVASWTSQNGTGLLKDPIPISTYVTIKYMECSGSSVTMCVLYDTGDRYVGYGEPYIVSDITPDAYPEDGFWGDISENNAVVGDIYYKLIDFDLKK